MNNLLRWTELLQQFGLIAHFPTVHWRFTTRNEAVTLRLHWAESVNKTTWISFNCSWFPKGTKLDIFSQQFLRHLHFSISCFCRHFSFEKKVALRKNAKEPTSFSLIKVFSAFWLWLLAGFENNVTNNKSAQTGFRQPIIWKGKWRHAVKYYPYSLL